MDHAAGRSGGAVQVVHPHGTVKPAAHLLVRDAGLFEDLAFGQEAVAGVEVAGGQLRMQAHLAPAALPGFGDQRLQQRLANALAAGRRQHCHAADALLGREPGGADRLTVIRARQHVMAERVQGIAFQLHRHLLFDHEHGMAHAVQQCLLGGVIGTFNMEAGSRVHAGEDSGSVSVSQITTTSTPSSLLLTVSMVPWAGSPGAACAYSNTSISTSGASMSALSVDSESSSVACIAASASTSSNWKQPPASSSSTALRPLAESLRKAAASMYSAAARVCASFTDSANSRPEQYSVPPRVARRQARRAHGWRSSSPPRSSSASTSSGVRGACEGRMSPAER